MYALGFSRLGKLFLVFQEAFRNLQNVSVWIVAIFVLLRTLKRDKYCLSSKNVHIIILSTRFNYADNTSF